jgi:low temperature requirement protein LtrA
MSGWRRLARVYPAGRGHEVTSFELLFDLLVAFGFAQVGRVILNDPTGSGLVRAVLVLGMLWGCWVSFALAANAAQADQGLLRAGHLVAIGGMVILGLALPRAFLPGAGLSARVLLVVAAYLTVRAASAVILRIVTGPAGTMRAGAVAAAACCSAGLLATSAVVPGTERIWCWAGALACEMGALALFTCGWRAGSAGHLADRFGFIIIFCLDMSLGGLVYSMLGRPVTYSEILLVCLSLLSAAAIWWLYFGNLAEHAEDATRAAVQAGDEAGNARLLLRHYGLLHYTALAGLLAYTTGLRQVGADLSVPGAGVLGARTGVLWAVCLAGGLAVFTATIAIMWRTLGRAAPATATDLAGAAFIAVLIPVLARQPALTCVAALTALAALVLAVQALRARRAGPRAAHEVARFPWPRRDPDEGTSPLELLCDVSFVAALSQSIRLVRLVPGLAGVLQALALSMTVFVLWVTANGASGTASLRPPAARTALLAQTAMFVLLAVIAPVAFATRHAPGQADGPLLLACVLTALMAAVLSQYLPAFAGEPVGLNQWVAPAALVPVVVVVWAGWVWPRPWVATALLAAIVLATTAGTLAMGLPNTFERWRVGVCPRFRIWSPQVYLERFAAAYLSACALVLELLDQLATSARVTLAMIAFTLAALGLVLSLFWLYRPLPKLAANLLDPRTARYTHKHQNGVNMFGVIDGHVLMVIGLGTVAAALAGDFLPVTAAGASPLGLPLTGHSLFLSAAGLAMVMTGQFLLSTTANASVDRLRAILIAAFPALIIALRAAPATVLITALAALAGAAVTADRRARTRQRTRTVQHASHHLTPAAISRVAPAAAALAAGGAAPATLADVPRPRPDLAPHAGFAVLDTNHDGLIGWHDFETRLTTLAAAPGTSHQVLAEVRAAYWTLWQCLRETMDISDDHIITAAEYAAYAHAITADPDLAATARDLITDHLNHDPGATISEQAADLTDVHHHLSSLAIQLHT